MNRWPVNAADLFAAVLVGGAALAFLFFTMFR